MIQIKETPQAIADQARISAYWANVRAGLHVTEPHGFGDDSAQRIRANKTKAFYHIEAAGRLMREVHELCDLEAGATS